MCEIARQQWAVEWNALQITGPLAEMARRLQTMKYSQSAYNQKR